MQNYTKRRLSIFANQFVVVVLLLRTLSGHILCVYVKIRGYTASELHEFAADDLGTRAQLRCVFARFTALVQCK